MKKLFGFSMAAVLAASLTACSGSTTTETTAAPAGETAEAQVESEDANDEPVEGEVLMIGGIGPLTGPAAAYGMAVKNGAEIAIEEINAAGGVNGMMLELNMQDDENDPEKAINAYNTLKDWGMQMLMGTVTSKPCIAVSAETAVDNMFLITPSASAVESIASDNAFRICFSDPNQGKASAKYMLDNTLGTKVAIIYDSSTEYSTGIRESFVNEATAGGIEIVADEAFTADTNTDFSVQLDKAKEAGAEIVFLPIYYQEASVILKQASDKGFAPIFFGCDGMDGILTVENFDTALAEGLMLLTPFSSTEEGSLEFTKAYETAYSETPNQFAADAYDAIYAIKIAAEKAGIDASMSVSDITDAMKVAMTEITVEGLTGSGMTWNPEGEPNKEPKAVKIVNGVYEMQ